MSDDDKVKELEKFIDYVPLQPVARTSRLGGSRTLDKSGKEIKPLSGTSHPVTKPEGKADAD